jgi:O-antigen ligase
MTTPFGFINTSTSAFYVSDSDDIELISNKDDKAFFKSCYNLLAQQGLLMSQNKSKSYKSQYEHYQKSLTAICNRTIHASGKDYYLQKNPPTSTNDKFAYAKAYYDIDKTCKNLTVILIKENFKKWIQLYFANILHGFNHWIIFCVMVLAFIFSFFKLILNYNKWHALLFIFSSLSILNTAVVALFTYSIARLVFYNYALLFLSFAIMIKLLNREFKLRKTKA